MTRRVAVVVLGDLGHSPRMQYHCLSLAEKGLNVDFVGYGGSEPQKLLIECPKIKLHCISECPNLPLPSIFGLFFKLIWQTITLIYALFFTLPKMNLILLQNPPGLPAILVCWLIAKMRKCRFLIDWHNYTYSILALRYGNYSFLVRWVKLYEFYFGRLSDGGFCVTKAMQADLHNRGITVITHYDRPSTIFRPLNENEAGQFLKKLSFDIKEFDVLLPKNSDQHRNNNTAMIISSTSWTPDENFDLLLSALKLYDDIDSTTLPNLLVVVTGKGPLKEFYVEKARDYGFKKAKLITPWLRAEDYPKLLACADLGVSLHYSSSNLDLPMKVVDMQGCALPVLALRYFCIDELIEDRKNGFLFENERKLVEFFRILLQNFPDNEILAQLKVECLEQREKRQNWDQAWDSIVYPYIQTYL